jgi:glycosyltransferase involved in cell wall biosynthesis
MQAVNQTGNYVLDGNAARRGAAAGLAALLPTRKVTRSLVDEPVVRGKRSRWTINGDFVRLRPTGVARYAREVVLALDALVAEGHPLVRHLDLDLVAPADPGPKLELRAIPVRVVPEFNRPRLPQFWVQAQLPRHVEGGLVSLCNLAPVAIRRQVACIHDLHTRLVPESYGLGFRLAHRILLPVIGRRAARITTVSEFSRSQLVRFGIAGADKIAVTYNGTDHATRWQRHEAESLDPGGRPYVFCLAQPQKYKNLDLLLALAPLLDAIGVDLLMAGSADADFVRRTRGAVPDNVRFLGQVDDGTLGAAFAGALCFAFPSRIEGFGLPAVEAMACGCPVIAADRPCLPEVCGDAALYADPDDPVAWQVGVASLLDPDRRAGLVAAGIARAGRYTWRGIAEQYLALMSDVDAETLVAQP